MGVITAWAVSGLFAVAFACGLPDPWRTDNKGICYSREKINIYNGIMNILTDIAICVLPVVMMWNVQTSFMRKCQVCALFGTRILVPALTIPALATGGKYFDNVLTDPTWYAVTPTVLAQISLNLSVLTACIPGLKSILDNLLSGTANARVDGGYNLTTSGDKKSPFIITPTLGTNGSGTGSASRSKGLASRVAQRFRPDVTQGSILVSGGMKEHEMSRQKSNTSPGRSESTRNLTAGMIIRTDHYEVSSVQRNSVSHPDFASRTSGDDIDDTAQPHSR